LRIDHDIAVDLIRGVVAETVEVVAGVVDRVVHGQLAVVDVRGRTVGTSLVVVHGRIVVVRDAAGVPARHVAVDRIVGRAVDVDGAGVARMHANVAGRIAAEIGARRRMVARVLWRIMSIIIMLEVVLQVMTRKTVIDEVGHRMQVIAQKGDRLVGRVAGAGAGREVVRQVAMKEVGRGVTVDRVRDVWGTKMMRS
jgi:hypothetical protein